MENLLRELKSRNYLKGIKVEFESEIVSQGELQNFSNLLDSLDIDLTIKLGGATSFLDINKARDINAKAIVAPMVESAYTVEKFIDTVKDVYGNIFPDLYLNIETKNAFTYLFEIFEKASFVKGAVLGRSDLSASLGREKSTVNSDDIAEYASMLQGFCHTHSKEFIVGGNVDLMSLPFFKKLLYLNAIETQKVIFDSSLIKSPKEYEENILLALQFEIEWLKNKQFITPKDELRISFINQKIELISYYKSLDNK